MAKLHIICGNCGCNDMFDWNYEPNLYDITTNAGTEYEAGVHIICRNCSTLHNLDDNAKQIKK